MEIVRNILARLKEPSTYAGLAALLLSLGISIDESILSLVIAGLTTVAGVMALVLKEKGNV